MMEAEMTNCTRCGEPKDVHDAGENYACQAQPTVTFHEETPITEREVLHFLGHAFRNIDLPPLSKDDLKDVAGGLARFAMTNARDGTE